MNTKWTLLLPLFMLLIAVGIWWKQHIPTQHIVSLPVVTHCQLHQQACQAHYENITLTLDLTPKPIQVAKQLVASVQVQGVTPKQIQLDINGSNMYMGYNRTTLKQQSQETWTGKSLLAFCTTEQMQWQLTLLLDMPDGNQLQIPFNLLTPFVHP